MLCYSNFRCSDLVGQDCLGNIWWSQGKCGGLQIWSRCHYSGNVIQLTGFFFSNINLFNNVIMLNNYININIIAVLCMRKGKDQEEPQPALSFFS